MTMATVATLICLFAANDNTVEWNGVSHVTWQDLRPLCPIDGESFDVRFQTYQFDITSAQVMARFDGSGYTGYPATYVGDRGPYAVWSASIPATAADLVEYYIAVTDGTDTDYFGANGMSDTVPPPLAVDFVTLSHAPIGATPHPDGGTIFKVWTPTRTHCWVPGTHNGWNEFADQLTKQGDYFIGYAPSADVDDQYKYRFNGPVWKPDARARRLNPSDSYNTYIVDPFEHDWVSTGYQTPDWEDLIIYELHVGTFSGYNDSVASGSFPATYRDVAAHVGHLAELGVTAVELMPITEFPMDESAGYNPITQWGPEWKYGTPEDLKYMVDVLHQHGIAVLADIVWNHFDFTDNYLWNYDGTQIYYDDPPTWTPWGDQADFNRDEVREYFVHSALYWLEEFRLDGFRMDATEYMDLEGTGGWSLMQWLNDTMDNRWIDKISIAEQLPDNAWITRPTSLGGAGFDSQWNDAFTDTLRQAIWDAASGSTNAGAVAGVLDGSGTYLEKTQVTNYFELHDEIWPSSGGQRAVKTIDTSWPHD